MSKTTNGTAIIGAGIAGITAAYWLARLGHRVTIYESQKHPAMMTSHANGSQLSVCNAGVWTTWPMVMKGLKWMVSRSAPFHVSPWPEPAKISWLARFLYHTYRDTASERTRETIALALASRQALGEIIREEGIDFDHVRRGILHIYASRSALDLAAKDGDLMRSAGCEWDVVTPNECRAMEPALASASLAGGIYTRSDSTGDMHMFCSKLWKVLKDRYGVRMCMDHEVGTIQSLGDRVLVNGHEHDNVVIASGVAAQRMARGFGDDLGIYPVKGYSITVDLRDQASRDAAPWISMLDDDAKIVCSRLGHDRLRVAGTAELVGNNRDICMHRVQPLLDWTQRTFPGIGLQSYKPWAGLRPMTPSMMPVVGPSRSPRVWYHAGHGHLGWTLGPGTAKKLALMMPS